MLIFGGAWLVTWWMVEPRTDTPLALVTFFYEQLHI